MDIRVDAKKIVLGTAQLGSNYGIMNQNNKLSKASIYSILERAWSLGVRTFDTAPGYNSEKLIGDFVKTHGVCDDIQILTKVSGLKSRNIQREISRSIEQSVENLNCQIAVLFLHDPDNARLLVSQQDGFSKVVKDFNLKEIGASIYETKSVEALRLSDLSLALQFPINFLDRRFENIEMNVGKRYARSIFLQGILSSKVLLNKNVPIALRSIHENYHRSVDELGIDPYALALSFAVDNSNVDYVLVGIDDIQQLDKVFSTPLIDKEVVDNISFSLSNIEIRALDPRNWTKE